MQKLSFDISNVIKSKKTKASTPWQVRGCELCDKLGSKNYPMFIRLYKFYPQVCERAYTFVIDSSADDKVRLFLWAIGRIRKDPQNGLRFNS